MPRKSDKEICSNFLIEDAEKNIEELLLQSSGYENDNRIDEIVDDLVDDIVEIDSQRYLYRSTVGKSNDWYQNILPNLNQIRYKQMLRMSEEHFSYILSLIKDDAVLKGPLCCQQFSIELQLTVVLYRLGSSGEGASIRKIAALFGIGDGGTIDKITKRIFSAILKLEKRFLSWPTMKERSEIVKNTMHELPYCIGYVDGTEIKLAEAPVQDPESFFSRKSQYSLKVQIICDHKRRIRHTAIGYPGSVHGARILAHTGIEERNNILSGMEWIVGDLAYKNTARIVTPYKRNSRHLTSIERAKFNKRLSKYRIRVEHTIGILKEKFPSLKELRFRLHSEENFKYACEWIKVCCILHNILISDNDVFHCDIQELDEEEDEDVVEDNQGENKREMIYNLMFNS